MRTPILSFLASLAMSLLSAHCAVANVNVCNESACFVKKVVMRSTIECPDYYYQTTFTCEHYLNPGECMLFEDGWDGGCYFTYTVESITWISMATTQSASITLAGPATVCSDCDGTYVATVGAGCSVAEVQWSRNGVPLGSGPPSLTLHLISTGTTTITASIPGASSTVTTTVLARPSPGSGAPAWGTFDVQCPPIQGAIIVSSSASNQPLGLTGGDGADGGAEVLQDTRCSCTCTGWDLKASFRIKVTKYYYDSRINNAADIAAVSAAEAQHVQSFQTCASGIASDYASMAASANIEADCLSLRTSFINLKNARINVMIAYNQNLDKPGGQHPTLGNSIKAHGGWGP